MAAIAAHGKPWLSKEFFRFAEFIGREWVEDGRNFDNDSYFKEVVAQAILFRAVEKLVSKAVWYEGGGYRANIVTYSIAKLASIIELQQPGHALDFKSIWSSQSISEALTTQIEAIARDVVTSITKPPVAQMNITEWCKKKDCWERVISIPVRMIPELARELVSPEDARNAARVSRYEGNLDAEIQAQIEVVQKGPGYWSGLNEWCKRHSPLFGRDADLVRTLLVGAGHQRRDKLHA